MALWLVLYLMSLGCLTSNSPPALPLLRGLLYEPLGHCRPLHYVPCHCGYVYVYEFLHERVLRVNTVNIATGFSFLYRTWVQGPIDWKTFSIRFSIPYFSISLSLNVLLTLMIIVRLVLHSRNTRTAAAALAGIRGLYRTVITMLIESSALYAVCSLLVIGTYLAGNCSADFSLPILAEAQVCAFPRSRSLDRLSDMTTDLIGHRSAAHH